MAIPSFFHPQLPPAGNTVTLDERESQHAAGARRLRVGDDVRLLDGAGTVADGTIEAVTKKAITLIVNQRHLVPAPLHAVHIACALPKGERQRNLLDMLTQIGIASFTPLRCERSVVKPRQALLERLQRVAIEACKQSHNPFLPEIRPPQDLAQVMAQVAELNSVCLVAHRDGDPFRAPKRDVVHVLVGPEGGFSQAELELAVAAGGVPVCFGSNILRVETAAVVAAGLLLSN